MTGALVELEQAIHRGDCQRVIELLDDQPELVDGRFAGNLDLSPLMWACRNRREVIAAELIDRGADVSAINRIETNGDGGNTALWFTAQGPAGGNLGIADRLIGAGAEIDRRCEHGQTAFYIATSWCHLELMQLLIDRGADPAIPNDAGRTPLEMLRLDLERFGRSEKLTDDQRRFVELSPAAIGLLREMVGAAATADEATADGRR